MTTILVIIVLGLLALVGFLVVSRTSQAQDKGDVIALQTSLEICERELESLKQDRVTLQQEVQHLRTELSLAVAGKEQTELRAHTLEVTLKANLENREQEVQTLRNSYEKLLEEKQAIQVSLSAVQVTLEQTEQRLEEAERSKTGLADLLEERFRGITTKIIDERAELIRSRSEESLKPLREDLKRFGEQVQNAYNSESRERHSLQNEIRLLIEHSQKMSQEANSLTKALKGDNKVQGDWGEMILENILESSGLRAGEEYTLQETLRDEAGQTIKSEESGQTMRPDAIIHYPNGRQVIIDSKVSLKAFSDYVSAETEEERNRALQAHIQSVRNQIKLLADKHYYAYVKESADFVMLFIPSEPAYILAMKEAPTLWDEAYKQNVVLINATNLLAALRMAKDLWVRDNQMKNIQKIFEEVGKLYDKFHGYISSFEDVEKKFQAAASSLEKAKGQLYQGSGNIMRKMEQLKDMGAKTTKQLPKAMLDED